MSKPDKPISEVSPSDKLKLPIDWQIVFLVSCVLGVIAFFVGVLTRWRALVIIADFLIGFAILAALIMGFVSLVKLFSTKK